MKTRKIDIFGNGKYLYSTNQFSRCKDALESARNRQLIQVAGRTLRGLSPAVDIAGMKLTANFSK